VIQKEVWVNNRKFDRRQVLRRGLQLSGVVAVGTLEFGQANKGVSMNTQHKTATVTANVTAAVGPQPFQVQVPQAVLDDLKDRLGRTRWPDEVQGAGWDYGTNTAYLKGLLGHWQTGFDWRKQERAINQFAQFRAEIDGLKIHFIHERSKNKNAMPILLLHGWPSSFFQMHKIIPLLTDGFDVVVGSLPGYGFSDIPKEKGMSVGKMAGLFHKLMTESLGYARYAVRGSDLGAGVIQQLGLMHPEALIGTHQSGTNPYVGYVPENLSPAEQEFLKNAQRWNQTEMAYAQEHSSKPQTLAFGLNDSPAGLASWIIEKFRTWADTEGNLEGRFSKDELLTNLTIYWATGTINSSMRLYYETARDQTAKYGRVEVPTALLMSPKDLFPTPREWAERSYNVVRWTEIDRGGHFLEWEEPELVATDIKAFFRDLK
jgi:pimeloyl-ACP methyl ester carboxylesterase